MTALEAARGAIQLALQVFRGKLDRNVQSIVQNDGERQQEVLQWTGLAHSGRGLSACIYGLYIHFLLRVFPSFFFFLTPKGGSTFNTNKNI